MLLAGPAWAQGEGSLPRHPSEGARETAPPFRHHASAFTGLTVEEETGGFTIGAQYEYRFHMWYGVGGLVQTLYDRQREFIIGPTFYLHPLEPLSVGLSPGLERADADWAFLFRIGLDYDFELRKGWTIAPSFALDFARGQRILVLGVSVGRIFGDRPETE
jgi:hypothetical protein